MAHVSDRTVLTRVAAWLVVLLVLGLSVGTAHAQGDDSSDAPATDNATGADVSASDAATAPAPDRSNVTPNAAAAGGNSNPLDDVAYMSLSELFLTNIYINSLLLGLSVLAVLLLVFFTLTISSSTMAPRSLLEELRRMVSVGDYKQAIDYCRANQRIFSASIAQRAIENAEQEQAIIMQVVEAEGRRRAELIWNRISYLADIANVAPMLGLLGTVIGMIQGFGALTLDAPGAKAVLLSENIAMAMATTMFGLVVAIIALACHALVKSRATAALAEVERAVHDVADQLGNNAAAAPPLSRGARP